MVFDLISNRSPPPHHHHYHHAAEINIQKNIKLPKSNLPVFSLVDSNVYEEEHPKRYIPY
jgi:hypothetical protein